MPDSICAAIDFFYTLVLFHPSLKYVSTVVPVVGMVKNGRTLIGPNCVVTTSGLPSRLVYTYVRIIIKIGLTEW